MCMPQREQREDFYPVGKFIVHWAFCSGEKIKDMGTGKKLKKLSIKYD